VTIAARLRSYGSVSTARIIGIDVARGLAVLGMYGAHIGVTDTFDWSQPLSWLDLVHGRSSILFATLAGVSIAIISGRTATLAGIPLLQSRVRILVRAALIFGIGGLLEYLGTGIAVILPMYATLFVLSLPFLRWRSRRLFIAAGVTALVSPLLLLVRPESFVVDTTIASSAFTDLLFFGTYPGITWMAFVFAGMAIGRLDLSGLRVQLRLLAVGVILAAVAYTVGGLGSAAIAGDGSGSSSSFPSSQSSSGKIETVPGEDVDLTGTVCDDYSDNTYYCYPEDYYDEDVPVGEEPSVDPDSTDFWSHVDPSSLVSIEPHSGTPFEVVGSGGFAIAVIALALLATRRRVIRWVLYPVASVGAMALTAYSAHVVVIFALGSYAWAGIDNWLYLWFVLGALGLCTIWTTLVGRGPLERLLTWVSRRTATLVPAAPIAPLEPIAPQSSEKTHD
jgi:uncharacterized protein